MARLAGRPPALTRVAANEAFATTIVAMVAIGIRLTSATCTLAAATLAITRNAHAAGIEILQI